MDTKKQSKITDHFQPEPVYGYNQKTNSWHCLICGVDMGPTNPRQLCGKYQCIGIPTNLYCEAKKH